MMNSQQGQQQPLYNQMQNMNINQQASNFQGLTNNAANPNQMYQNKMPNALQSQPYQNNQAFGNWNAASGHTLSTQLWK